MATGRIGVTPVLRTRWSKLPTTGTTVLSGLDDNSVALVYDAGYEAVYRNGVLLSRGNDYTATDGTTVTLIDATLATDIIEIFANDLVPLTDAISKGQYNAKGALLSATAASTPAVLAVGSNDQVLTADSTTSTGLKWATAASGAMTLLSTTTLSGTSTTISSIPQTYKHLFMLIDGINQATVASQINIRPNNANTYYCGITGVSNSPTTYANTNSITGTSWDFGTNNGKLAYWLYDYTNANSPSPGHKAISFSGVYVPGAQGYFSGGGGVATTSAITSIVISSVSTTFNGGTVRIYGVN